MHARVHIASIGFAVLLLIGVFELVRRGRLRERYALLWLAAGLVLLLLAVWQHLLAVVSKAIGIYNPANAFFVIAFAFVLLLLLHFCASVSRLADQNRVLAQRLALLEQGGNARRAFEEDSDLQNASAEPIASDEDWTLAERDEVMERQPAARRRE